MDSIQQSFSVKFDYKVYFASDLFRSSNSCFKDFLRENRERDTNPKILFVIDENILKHHHQLPERIKDYFGTDSPVTLAADIVVVPGGEVAKNNFQYLQDIITAIDANGIDRHSYVAAVGGGSVLDLTGFASAISHRGIRHIRIPTTVLSQDDSGVGVKNGINYRGKKNFLGTFVPPVAVFNDSLFLTTLDERNWRSGIAEAVKVALIKDAGFFYWIEENAAQFGARDQKTMDALIHRSAELHLQHIASGDPFEMGSSRPLDFGHWSAHKLEQLTGFQVLHGEAVAMGIALDTTYSAVTGLLPEESSERVIRLLERLGFEITHPLLRVDDTHSEILAGLNEFREHLGGRLTIMILEKIGKGKEVHEIDMEALKKASKRLQKFHHLV